MLGAILRPFQYLMKRLIVKSLGAVKFVSRFSDHTAVWQTSRKSFSVSKHYEHFNPLRPAALMRHWLVISGLNNGLSPVWCQAIAWVNVDLESIGPLATNISQIGMESMNFLSTKLISKSHLLYGSYFLGLKILYLFCSCRYINRKYLKMKYAVCVNIVIHFRVLKSVI